jgi:hypothetical protein
VAGNACAGLGGGSFSSTLGLVFGHERSSPLLTNGFVDDVFHKLRDLPKRPHCGEHPNRLFNKLLRAVYRASASTTRHPNSTVSSSVRL